MKNTATIIICGYILFTGFLFFRVNSHAQTPDWKWAKGIGGNLHDFGNQVITDSSGNVYTWGQFGSNSIKLGSFTLYNNIGSGSGAPYMAKYNPDGTVSWAKSFPTELAAIYNISLDSSGNLYVSGQFYGTLVLGGKQLTYNDGGLKTCVAKYTPSGNIVWLKRIGSNSYYSVTSAVRFVPFDKSNLVAFGNSFNDTLIGSPTGKDKWASWVAKMDMEGNLSSVKILGDFTSGLAGMVTDHLHNFYIAGNYSRWVFNTDYFRLDTLKAHGSREAFIAKFDKDLNFIWSKITYSAHRDKPGAGFTSADGLAVDLQNNVYLLGDTKSDTLSFDASHEHTLTRPNYFDIPLADFLVKFSPEGNIIWDNVYPRNASYVNRPRLLCSDRLGNMYYAGGFSGGQGITLGEITVFPEGNSNLFVAKFTTSGMVEWIQKNSLTGNTFINSIVEDGKGNLYMTGLLQLGNAGFGNTTVTLTTPVQSNVYAGDAFFARLGNCTPIVPLISPNEVKALCKNESVTFETSGADTYLWSTYETTSSVSVSLAGEYFVYGIDRMGCYAASDTVQVAQTKVDTKVEHSDKTLIASAANAVYQWVNCNEEYKFIDSETEKTYSIEESGRYAVIVEQNSCKDTSSCYEINITSNELGIKPINASVKLYPNPGHGRFQLEIREQGEGVAALYDLSGRKLFETNIISGINELNYGELSAGIYQLNISLNAHSDFLKLIVDH